MRNPKRQNTISFYDLTTMYRWLAANRDHSGRRQTDSFGKKLTTENMRNIWNFCHSHTIVQLVQITILRINIFFKDRPSARNFGLIETFIEETEGVFWLENDSEFPEHSMSIAFCVICGLREIQGAANSRTNYHKKDIFFKISTRWLKPCCKTQLSNQ